MQLSITQSGDSIAIECNTELTTYGYDLEIIEDKIKYTISC